MKKKLSSIIYTVLFLSGLSLMLYPYLSKAWNAYRQSKLASNYGQIVTEETEERDYSKEWDQARAYNEALYEKNDPYAFARAEFAEEPDEVYLSCLDIMGDGMMGYLEIPTIDIKLPIYHTTDESVLEDSVGHLEGSSLPVGGENTHAVLSAHRGLPNTKLFTALDSVKVGDTFYMYILDEVLAYEVDQILVVEPAETSELLIQEGQDYVTLFTCTPFAVNTHRLLVRGHRVENSQPIE